MNQLHIKKIPEAIYALNDPRGADALRDASYSAARWMHSWAMKGSIVSDYHLRTVRENPLVCSYLGEAGERSPVLDSTLNDNAAGVFFTLTAKGNYEKTDVALERQFVVPDNGEYVFTLLLWAKRAKKCLRLPAAVYEEALLRDPYWGSQAFHCGLISSGDFIERMRQWVEENKDSTPGAAFLWLLKNETSPLGDMAKTIQRNPFYSYLALHFFSHRGFILEETAFEHMTPRWAYHCLCLGGAIDEPRLLRDFLMKDPGWFVEFVAHEQVLEKDVPKAYQMYVECMDASYPHPLIQPMHDFFDRHREKMKSPRPPAFSGNSVGAETVIFEPPLRFAGGGPQSDTQTGPSQSRS